MSERGDGLGSPGVGANPDPAVAPGGEAVGVGAVGAFDGEAFPSGDVGERDPGCLLSGQWRQLAGALLHAVGAVQPVRPVLAAAGSCQVRSLADAGLRRLLAVRCLSGAVTAGVGRGCAVVLGAVGRGAGRCAVCLAAWRRRPGLGRGSRAPTAGRRWSAGRGVRRPRRPRLFGERSRVAAGADDAVDDVGGQVGDGFQDGALFGFAERGPVLGAGSCLQRRRRSACRAVPAPRPGPGLRSPGPGAGAAAVQSGSRRSRRRSAGRVCSGVSWAWAGRANSGAASRMASAGPMPSLRSRS